MYKHCLHLPLLSCSSFLNTGSIFSGYTKMFFIGYAAIAGGISVYKFQHEKNIKSNTNPLLVVETMPCLPLDIIAEVLPYLSLKDLLRCKTVCKQWQTLIQEALTEDPNFANNFTMCKPKTYTFHYIPCSAKQRKKKTTWLLATCNGLDLTMERSPMSTLSLAILEMWGFFIRNRETREVLRLPNPGNYKITSQFAFTFIPSTNEYKVATVYSIDDTTRQYAVLTLAGSGKLQWRYFEIQTNYNETILGKRSDDWVVQAGSLVHCIDYMMDGSKCAYQVMSFDLESETALETHVHLAAISRKPEVPQFALSWNGSLAFVCIDGEYLNVLVLEDPKEGKWRDRFSVCLTFLKESKTDNFVPLVAQHGLLWLIAVSARKVIGYNIESKRIVQTLEMELNWKRFKLFCQVPSLTSLKAMQTDV